jgi:hypothetical protein
MSRALPLPKGWGEARLEQAPLVRLPRPDVPVRRPCAERWTTRSYDHRGTMLVWRPAEWVPAPRAFACDLEHKARFSGTADPARVDARLCIERWVATEVVAKLLQVPVLVLIVSHGLLSIASGGVTRVTRVDLRRYGSRRYARMCLLATADRQHVAAFGIVDDASLRGSFGVGQEGG